MDYPKGIEGIGLVGGRFVDENPVTGQQGSLIVAPWANQVTDEILNVLNAVNIEPSEEKNNQLAEAIKKIVSDGLGSIKKATETQIGIVQLATGAEAQAGIVKDKVISPSSLATVTATEDRSGLIQIASDEEVMQGVDTAKAVTPAGLLGIFAGSQLENTGYQILPGGLILQWGLIGLSAIGNYNAQTIGGVTYYTQYYSVAFPMVYPKMQWVTFASQAGTPFSSQIPQNSMELYINRATDSTAAQNPSRFTLSIRTNKLGVAPIIHWMSLGH